MNVEQESHAKVSARPQCVYEGPWRYGSIFIRLAVVASQVCEISRNSPKIQTYSSSRSSKVIDLGANRKRICNFLLVINSIFVRISYLFRAIDAFRSKIACFPHPTIVWRTLAEERPAISM